MELMYASLPMASLAGKNFTMDGPKEITSDSEQFDLKSQSGILPRTAVFLFTEIERLNS